MVQSPSWAANWPAASQEIPRISRNPKVHYRTHNRPPPVSILGQPNPVHIPTSHLEIHQCLGLPSSLFPSGFPTKTLYTPSPHRSILILSTHLRLGLPSGLFPSGFPTKTLYTPSPHPCAPHAQPRPIRNKSHPLSNNGDNNYSTRGTQPTARAPCNTGTWPTNCTTTTVNLPKPLTITVKCTPKQCTH